MKLILNRLVSIVLLFALVFSMTVFLLPPATANAAVGTTYYIDFANGNDTNIGTSESTAWKTFANVNGKTTFHPGDQILLKRGTTFTHTFSGNKSNGALILASSGTAEAPIVIGSYGEGPKPVINANGAYSAIRVDNQEYFTIQDLELTNYKISNENDFLTEYWRRSGIWISCMNDGTKRGITIRNMTIHKVNGMSITGETTVTTVQGDKDVNKNANAGILLNAWKGENTARYDGVLIENNTIYDVAGPGISIDGHQQQVADYHDNVVVRGNSINNTGADGIIVGVSDSPVVEYNVSYNAGRYGNGSRWIGGMWFWRTNEALMQYNEVGHVSAREKMHSDSTAFDTDVLTTGDHIFQYNYSHDNEGGFFMDMGRLVNGKNIVRYNISQNDKRDAFRSTILNITDPGWYYNNVFYNDKGDGFAMKENPRAVFINNVFYYTSDSSGNYTGAYPTNSPFYYNAFYGQPAPAQAKGSVIGDPKFVDPGKGADGRNTVNGYKLQADSPLIGKGAFINDNGGLDFWGNTLYSGRADIGAFEYPGSNAGETPNKPDKPEVVVEEVLDTTVRLSWDAEENDIPLVVDIFNAETDEKVASAFFTNELTIEELTPDTHYSFYVKAKNAAGNYSDESDEIQVRTCKSILLDDTDATKTGTWTVSTTDITSFDGQCSRANPGTDLITLEWTPDIPDAGYYAIYTWNTRGGSDRARNAPFTVSSGGNSKTYLVDQTPLESGWIHLGIQKLNAGEASIKITNRANAMVSVDAVKLVYIDNFTYEDIKSVIISADKVQIGIGDTSNLTVTGVDELGRQLDLVFDGAEVEYVIDNPEAISVEDGVATGLANGSAFVSAQLSLDGRQITSNRVEIFVGEVLLIRDPEFTDAGGSTIESLVNGTVNTSLTIINSTERKMRVTMIVALYSPEGLVKYDTSEKAVFENSTVNFTVAMEMPEDLTGHYLKVYLWDSLAMLRPIKEVTGLQ